MKSTPPGRMMVEQNEQAKIAADEPTETTPDAASAQPAAEQSEGTREQLAAFWAAGGTFGMALHDGLAPVQQEGNAAARISGEHISNLLYGTGAVERHTAPYTGRDYPNPNDYRDDKRR